MVLQKVVFLIISKIGLVGFPKYVEMVLFGLILDPIIFHADSSGAFFCFPRQNYSFQVVVSHNWYLRLGIA